MVEANSAIVILGMHRSGTSALGGVLQRLGVDFGNKLMPAIENVNEKGFYEHLKVVEVHEKILKQLGSCWQDLRPLPNLWWQRADIAPLREELENIVNQDFVSSSLWGLKDPRMCRLLPLWFDIMSKAKVTPRFIIAIRHPDEVSESLQRRDDIDREAAYILWIWHVLDSLKHSERHKRYVLDYVLLLNDWGKEMNNVSRVLGVEWAVSTEDAEAVISTFLDKSLKHCTKKDNADTSSFVQMAHQLYKAVLQEDFIACEAIDDTFRKHIMENKQLGLMTDVQVLRETNAHLSQALVAEKANARAQIEYRDALLLELEQQRDALLYQVSSRRFLAKAFLRTFRKGK